MKKKNFLTVKELQDNIKSVLRRPVPDNDIEEFDKITELDDEHERKNKKSEPKKIAKLPEVDQ